MILKKCDRCGYEANQKITDMWVTLTLIGKYRDGGSSALVIEELCPSCLLSIKEFITGKDDWANSTNPPGHIVAGGAKR